MLNITKNFLSTESKIKEFHKKPSHAAVALVFFIIGLLIYSNALSHPFVHDDVVFIQKNRDIVNLNDIPSLFFNSSDFFRELPIVNTYYRPLLEIVYRVQYRLFGLAPFWYHLCNIVIHILNSILVYWLLTLIFNDKRLGFSVSLLFLVHPVQTESVSYIAGISDLLYSFFCLSSFIFYVISIQKKPGRINIFLYALSLALFSVGLFAKEQAAIFPFLIILYEYYRFSFLRKQSIGVYLRSAGIFIIFFGYILFRKIVLVSAFPHIFEHSDELLLRILSIPKTLLKYIGMILFPFDLHFYRTTNILDSFVFPTVIFVVLAITAFFLIRYLPKREKGISLFGLGWFIIILLPVLNIIPMVLEYSFIWTVEHFLYLPLAGFMLFVIPIVRHYGRKVLKGSYSKIILPIFFAILFTLMLTTINQNKYWSSEIKLFKRAARFEGHLGRVRRLLGQAYYFNNRPNDAIREYKKALRKMKFYARQATDDNAKSFYLGFVKGLHFDLAHCYEQKKDFLTAVKHYKKAIDLDPHDSVLHNNIGVNYMRLNDIDNASKYFEKAISINPNNEKAINNLAICYIKNGNFEKAKILLRKIARRYEPARKNLQKLLNRNK